MKLNLSPRRRAALAGIAAIVLSVLGGGRAPAASEPFTLTAILPLTGSFAFAGQSQQEGLQVLQRFVNRTGGVGGRPLQFQFLDDQSSPQLSVQLLNGVIAAGAQAVLGGAGAAQCRATAPLVAHAGPILYCISPAVRPDSGGFVFSSGVQPFDELTAALHFFRDKGWTKIAFLATNDASGQEADSNFNDLIKRPENSSIQVVGYEHYGASDINVSAQISRIKAANPQALVIWAAGQPIATAFHGMHDGGLDIPVVTSFAMQEYSAMDQLAQILPTHLYFASSKWPAYDIMTPGPVRDQLATFFSAFKAEKIAPDAGEQLAWDPALLLISSFRKLGPNAKAAQIHDYMESLRSFPGTSGIYDFTSGDQRGLGLGDVVLSEWTPLKRAWIAVSDAGGAALKPNQKVSGK
jgi:branched-chain amino acid transport system substrate-binding protein